MITDTAYAALSAEVTRQGKPDGVLGEALLVHESNYVALTSANPTWTKTQVEAALLLPTTITSAVAIAAGQFKGKALAATTGDRRRMGLKEIGGAIALGVAGNIAFVLLTLLFFLVAQDTATSFFRSLGVQLVSVERERSPGSEPRRIEHQRRLPSHEKGLEPARSSDTNGQQR